MRSNSRSEIATGSFNSSSIVHSATSISRSDNPTSNTTPNQSIAQAQIPSPNFKMPSISRPEIATGSSVPPSAIPSISRPEIATGSFVPPSAVRSSTSNPYTSNDVPSPTPIHSVAQPRFTAPHETVSSTRRFAIATGSLNPSSSADSASPMISFARQPKPIHKTWNAVFVRTAKCDICNKNKHAVIQRCVDCNHQLCTDCMMRKSWNPGHGADFDELRWIDNIEPVKKTRKPRAAPTPTPIKNAQTTTLEAKIVGNKRTAPEGSQANRSGYSKKARLENPELIVREQQTAYSSVGNNNNIGLAISHQPPLGDLLANEAISVHSILAGQPGRATIDDGHQMGHKERLPKKGGSLVSLTNSNVSASTKLRVRRKALTTAQVEVASNDSVRRQSPRRQSVVNYNEHQGQEDEQGGEEEDAKFISYSREEKVMLHTAPAKSRNSTRDPDHVEKAVKSFKASTKPNPDLSLRHGEKNKEPLNSHKDKIEVPSKNSSPRYTQSALASGSGYSTGSIGASYVSGGNVEGYKHLGEFFSGPQEHASPYYNPTAKAPSPNNPVLQAPTTEPAGSKSNVQGENSDPLNFARTLAKVVKDKAEQKKKEEEAKKLAAFNLECAKNWDNAETFVVLRGQGKADEAWELFQTTKTMLAMAHGITLNPNDN